MQCLTEREVSEWLGQHNTHEDPYHGRAVARYYLQFHAPTSHSKMDALARHYYERIILRSESLFHITDWSLYTPSEMIAVSGIRSSHGEKRLLIDAPGHHIDPDESEVGISLYGLSVSFGWTAYLYSSTNRTTIYNWEGEIFDFWTDCELALAEMRKVIGEFKLEETKKQNKAEMATPRKPSD